MSRCVLHVADYAATYPGAFITQLRMLDEELRRRGTARCAFAFPPNAQEHGWFRRLQAEGTCAVTVTASPTRSPLSAARELARIAQGTDASIIHTHFGSYDLAAALATVQLRRRGHDCRLVWHYRTALEEPVGSRGLVRRIKDVIRFRLPARLVDRCFTVTHALADEAAQRGMGHRAAAMVAGCDTETFRPEPATRARVRDSLGISPDDTLILHLGWAWHRKGGDLLAAAARRLPAEKHGRLVFVSVGAPHDVPPVRTLPFTERIDELHQAADIFVSASRSEGFGNGVVEAMSSGTVVVAALAGGQREIFQHMPGCVAVPVDDAPALAAGIEELLSRRPQWDALGAANRTHITTHYDMRDWARRMADAYDDLAPARMERR